MGIFSRKTEARGVDLARDIAPLCPDLYVSALRAGGKPVTDGNLDAAASFVAKNLALNAHGWFQATGDTAARDRFNREFNPEANDARGIQHVADEMIDFLWNWTSRCHPGLRDFVEQIKGTLVGRLADFGNALPADIWSSD